MKLHRFYVYDTELTHTLWVKDKALFHQWSKVLRFKIGREVSLFNDKKVEKLYKIEQFGSDETRLEFVTDIVAKLPNRDVYLCFSLLKKDKNDWVLQKATELGVTHLVPLLCDRTEKTGFDDERATKIVIEAVEQCGRVDIPRFREPLSPQKAIEELSAKMPVYVMEQGGTNTIGQSEQIAILIGPEGGWSDKEKEYFIEHNVKYMSAGQFTLRAETAAVTAAALLQ